MTWQIDDTHTHIGFSVKHMMVTTVRGQFRKYRGAVHIDPDDFRRSHVTGEIDVASIDTGNKDRDAHLRTNDFFDVPNHPVMRFQSTSIEEKGDGGYAVRGDLTIRGVTKEVVFDVEFSGTTVNPWGKTVAGVSARGSVNRKDFGVNFNALLEAGGMVVGDHVKLELELEAAQQADAQVAA